MKTKRRVEIETAATVFERSVQRNVIVTVEPNGVVGFRLKGTRRTYELRADALYCRALKVGAEARHSGKGKG